MDFVTILAISLGAIILILLVTAILVMMHDKKKNIKHERHCYFCRRVIPEDAKKCPYCNRTLVLEINSSSRRTMGRVDRYKNRKF